MGISDAKVRSLKAAERPYKLSDSGGLHILVQPSGAKLWRISYRFRGKQKTLSLGAYPAVSLARAREGRDKMKILLARGIDPSANRKAEKAAAMREAIGETWREVSTEYREKREREKAAPATIAKLIWLLNKTYPALGEVPVRDIGVTDLLPVLRAVEAEGAHESARRLRSVCGRVFRYAIATGRADRDVARDLGDALTAPTVRHRPGLTDPAKVGDLMRRIRAYSGDPVTRGAMLVSAYCFLRPGEVRHLEWADVDWKAARVTIPAERMKMPRAHIVPLAPQVVEVLREVQPVTGSGPLVFASRLSKGRPISENTVNQALTRMGYDTGRDHCAHGFRTTASTLLNEAGWNRDWIERQLAHVEGNAVRAAYNSAEYIADRERMLHWWADHLDRLAASPR